MTVTGDNRSSRSKTLYYSYSGENRFGSRPRYVYRDSDIWWFYSILPSKFRDSASSQTRRLHSQYFFRNEHSRITL
jgi:hypothetical protein